MNISKILKKLQKCHGKKTAASKLIIFLPAWHNIVFIKKGVRDCNSEVWYVMMDVKDVGLQMGYRSL